MHLVNEHQDIFNICHFVLSKITAALSGDILRLKDDIIKEIIERRRLVNLREDLY